MNKKFQSSEMLGAFSLRYLHLKKGGDFYEEGALFLDRIGVEKEHRIFLSRYSPTVIALISEEELERAREDERFLSSCEYSLGMPKKESCEAILTEIGMDESDGTNSPEIALRGKGVRVGVISSENEIFNPLSKSLEGVKIEVLDTLFPPTEDPHPTAVVSEIVGNRLDVEGEIIMGAVRDATLFFAPTRTLIGVYRAIERMLDLQVKVINFSAGIKSETGYSAFDRQIDAYLRENDFLFFTSSGNEGVLTSPAWSFLGVAVGNLKTKDAPFKELPPPWSTSCLEFRNCSGFTLGKAYPHKPDVVAPADLVPHANEEGRLVFSSGTSFASPLATSVAVTLIEKSEGRYSYLTIKALIILSARREVISGSDNPLIENSEYIRERTGYGLISATNALEALERAEIFEGRGGVERSFTLKKRMGDEVELAFVFEKRENEEGAYLVLDGERFELGVQNTIVIKKRSREENPILSVYYEGEGRFSAVVL